jgi:hypothetical protein
VFETAEFMATWPRWDEGGQRFNLGPPLIPAQECYSRSRDQVINPTFELAYWHWALDIAQQWRERLGLPRDPEWDKVLQQLARPLVRDGVYAAMETEPFTRPVDHPSMLAALGVVPSTPLIDPAIMGRTLEAVRRTWNWGGTWGWDFPMGAMTAARVGRPDEAVAWLMMETPKNRYLPNGHNYQTPDLPLYLPGNGGLLTAVALMAAGWDGNTNGPAPGFPRDGTWRVRYENLSPLP